MPQPIATEIRLNNILKCFTIAVDTLEVLAKTFKSPLLEPISNTAKSLLTAVQNVKQNKIDCTQLLEQTYGLLCAVVSLHMKPETGPDLSPSMLNHLGKVTETLFKIHTFVEAQQDKSKIRRFFRQGEMGKLLKDCNMGLQEALDLFKVHKMNFLNEIGDMQRFAEARHQEVLELISTFSDGTTSDERSVTNRTISSSYNSSTSISMLPAEPKIFHGRESEIADILKLFMQETPRIAILGAGGMGKTSLSRVILHHPTVTGKYGHHRFFIACDTVSSSSKDELVTLIGAHLGLKPKKNLANVVLHHFVTNPACLLILDNLETLWEPTEIRRDIEEFLSLLTDITMRGTERPASVRWTRPFLPVLKPLTPDAARQTFIDIADDVHDSDDINKVLLLTDNMPLAIDLMAHLVESEGCSNVLARWEKEKNLNAELGQSRLPIKDILSCKSALLSTSLAYSDDQKRFKVLVPIREYMARSYPPMDYLVQALLNYFHQLFEFRYKYLGTVSASEMTLKIASNFSNIHSLLLNRLQHQNPAAFDTIYCILYLNAFGRLNGHGRTPLMDHITLIQPLPSDLEVLLITEIFSSWEHYPVLNPEALVDKAIKQLPHCNESDIKSSNYFQTGLSLALSTGNTRRQCHASLYLAYLNMGMGDPAACQMYASEARRLAKISADLFNEAHALHIEAMCSHSHGNYKYAASLCDRAMVLIAHCGMSGGTWDSDIMTTQAETHKFKSEYVEAKSIRTKILHRSPIESGLAKHAVALLNIAELEVQLGVPMEDVRNNIGTAKSVFNRIENLVYEMVCDTTMGSLYLRERNLLPAKSLFHKCLSFFYGNQSDLVNCCLEQLGDRSLWDSTNWPSSWTIIYLVYASKSNQKLDLHKALQFLGDSFQADGDQDTAVSLLTTALEGFTQMDVHRSRAECMLQLGYISKENGDLLKTADFWRTARPLFERSSQAKKVALIDKELLSIAGDVLEEHTRSLALLPEIHAPSAALEMTAERLVEEIGDTGLGKKKELVAV
ncbi:hypothetical protein DFH09DRAFT_1395812 [Mycena vulgaris]|nr:hypothetical protein DFH09DRAFT_1395812 [Mycena vulgaris]